MPRIWASKPPCVRLAVAGQSGDRIELAGRDTSPTYTVSAVHSTDQGDVNLVLTAERGQ